MNNNETALLGFTKKDKMFVFFITVGIGGLVGWFIPVIASWILKLPIVPWEKIVTLIATLDSIWVSILAALVGVVLGIWLAFLIFAENLEVTLSYDDLQVKYGERTDIIHKNDISAIYMEKKQLIILGKTGNELFRGVLEDNKEKARDAFYRYRFPWFEDDPYKEHYERWVMGHPDFPEKINALLHAREHALKEDDEKDAKQLRQDLAKLGAVIKDDNHVQYVRMAQDSKLAHRQ